MHIQSLSFDHGQLIPKQYTCSGKNVSPHMKWDEAPGNTRSFALILDDPDAPSGAYTHWVVYNIPAGSRELAENMAARPQLPDGTLQGQNDFQRIGYGGPCPPEGRGPHRYVFRLYALDDKLSLEAGASKAALERAMQGHIIDHAETVGRYER